MRHRILFYISSSLLLITLTGNAVAYSPINSTSVPIHYHTYQPHYQNLWDVLPQYFQLNRNLSQPNVRNEINFLKKHPSYINELSHNTYPYLFYVFSEVQQKGLPAEIALIPMIESDYDPFRVSAKGAAGLWQMMPQTASALKLTINSWYDGRRNILASTNAALTQLKYLHHDFGDWLLAFAAYNCGDGKVHAAISYNQRHHRPTDFWSLPLPQETKQYVPKLLALAAVIAQQHHYGLPLHRIPNHPYFVAISVVGQLRLNQLAQLADTDSNTLRILNPGFSVWNDIPNGNYWILLPSNKLTTFHNNIKKAQDYARSD